MENALSGPERACHSLRPKWAAGKARGGSLSKRDRWPIPRPHMRVNRICASI